MGGPRDGSDFQNLHRNKRSMTLNLKAPEGLRRLQAHWSRKPTCVVENFRPNVKTRLGIDYKTLRKINPRLVYASISGFGQDGPYRDRPGFDQIAQGMGGLMSITGLPGQGPVRVGIPVADLTAGLFAALGILVALLGARHIRQGPGDRDLAACRRRSSCSTFRPRVVWSKARWRSRPATIIRPRSRPACSRPRDGYINIATTGGKMWERFCRTHRRRGAGAATRTTRPPRRARRTATRSMPRSRPICKAAPAPNGSSASTRPACRAGRSTRIDQVFADPQVRASRHRAERRAERQAER